MKTIYLQGRDEHINLDCIERVCHDVNHNDALVTVVFLIGGEVLHIHDSDDRVWLRECLDRVNGKTQ